MLFRSALDVADALGERAPGGLVDWLDPCVPVERRAQVGSDRRVVQVAPAEADEGEALRKQPADPELEDGRHHLAAREVAGCSEEDDDVRIGDPLDAQTGAQRIPGAALRRRAK